MRAYTDGRRQWDQQGLHQVGATGGEGHDKLLRRLQRFPTVSYDSAAWEAMRVAADYQLPLTTELTATRKAFVESITQFALDWFTTAFKVYTVA